MCWSEVWRRPRFWNSCGSFTDYQWVERMAEYPSRLPDAARFAAGIQDVLHGCGAAQGAIRVLERKPNLSRSTVPCERVTCQEENGRIHRLFCKFGTFNEQFGPNHRLGVGYEAGVYRHVLRHSRAALPRFYGSFTDPTADAICLVLECVDEVVPLSLSPNPEDALRQAAVWLAQFHSQQELASPERFLAYLVHYDMAYYQGWVRRTAEFSRPLHGRFPWLPLLCQRAEGYFEQSLTGPITVVHGECYATNWLVGTTSVFPIDWESAALATAAIDVASVTWSWGEEMTKECTREYLATRWPQGIPAYFEGELQAAQLYLAFRWLGDRPEWTTAPDPPACFEELKATGEQAGLI